MQIALHKQYRESSKGECKVCIIIATWHITLVCLWRRAWSLALLHLLTSGFLCWCRDKDRWQHCIMTTRICHLMIGRDHLLLHPISVLIRFSLHPNLQSRTPIFVFMTFSMGKWIWLRFFFLKKHMAYSIIGANFIYYDIIQQIHYKILHVSTLHRYI